MITNTKDINMRSDPVNKICISAYQCDIEEHHVWSSVLPRIPTPPEKDQLRIQVNKNRVHLEYETVNAEMFNHLFNKSQLYIASFLVMPSKNLNFDKKKPLPYFLEENLT